MKRTLLFAAAITICVLTTEVPVEACSCMGSGPPCEATWQAGAVFVGEVVSIQEAVVDRSDLRAGYQQRVRRVTFRIREAFRGTDGETVVVETGLGGGDCGYNFAVGGSYLIYAHRYQDQLSTGICSRTRPVADAAEDLAYLRGPARQPAGLATVYGTARQRDPLTKEYVPWESVSPFAGGRVIVESVDLKPVRKFEATTGPDGKYSVQVPAGKYRAELNVRDGLYATVNNFRANIDIRDPRGCSLVDFAVLPDGRIGGRVLDAGGKPVIDLSVDLARAESLARSYYTSEQRTRTNAAGEFEFTRLAPSSYVLGLMLMQEPKKETTSVFFLRPPATEPERYAVAPEQRVWAGELQLPDSVQLTRITGEVSGHVRNDTVRTQAYVLTSPNERIAAGPVPLDASGSFSFTVIAGRTYRVSVEEITNTPEYRLRRAQSEPFNAAPGAMSFSLRFEK